MQTKCCSFYNFTLFLFFYFEKKLAPALLVNFFPESNDPPKVATPKGLLILKVTWVASMGTLR